MNENSFVAANALQTVNLVKKFMSFNMSESLSDFLEGAFKKKAVMETEMNTVLSNIQILEAELDKIEKAILEDPSYADIKEISDAKTLIENELNSLKSEWQAKSDELNKFETVAEGEEEEEEDIEVIEDPKEPTDDEPAADGEPEGEPAKNADEEPTNDPADDEPADSIATDDAAIVASTENPVGDDAPPAEPVQQEEPIAEPVQDPAKDSTIVNNGLLGAEGAQTAGIPGNDHLDANAQGAATDGQIMNAGFAGAEGNQQGGTMTDALTGQAAQTQVLTPGDEAAKDPAADDAAQVADDAAKVADEAPVNADDAEKAEGAAVVIDVKKDEEEIPNESVKENKNTLAESIGVDSKVIDKVSGQNGTVTATNDEKFSILLDDGTAVERTLADLEDVADEIEQNIANNEKPVDAEAPVADAATEGIVKNENEEATNATGVEGADAEKPEETMFVHATLTIDIGPFKAGDAVEIDAASYTSSGDDEPIKLKEPKDGVSEVPKKYLAVADNAPEEGGDDVDSKVAAVLQQIADLETFLNDENTKGSKAIEDAKEKIKKFAKSLEATDEVKPEEKSGDTPSEEVK